jgi:preprotein translocase subunit SecD
MQTLKTALVGTLAATLLAGCAAFQNLHKQTDETTLRIYEEVDTALPADNKQTVEIPHTDMRLTINPFPTLTEKDVLTAELYDTAGGKAIFLRFDPNGAILLDEMTTRCRGQHVVIMINNRPVAAWLVNDRIVNGQFLVEGDFTDEQARKVVDDLNKLSKKTNR